MLSRRLVAYGDTGARDGQAPCPLYHQRPTKRWRAFRSAGSKAWRAALGLREEHRVATGLDERTFALVKVAVLIALDAPPASFGWQVADAVDAGVTAEDILGVLRAVAPHVGAPRVVGAAPEIMLALGLSLPDGPDYKGR